MNISAIKKSDNEYIVINENGEMHVVSANKETESNIDRDIEDVLLKENQLEELQTEMASLYKELDDIEKRSSNAKDSYSSLCGLFIGNLLWTVFGLTFLDINIEVVISQLIGGGIAISAIDLYNIGKNGTILSRVKAKKRKKILLDSLKHAYDTLSNDISLAKRNLKYVDKHDDEIKSSQYTYRWTAANKKDDIKASNNNLNRVKAIRLVKRNW